MKNQIIEEYLKNEANRQSEERKRISDEYNNLKCFVCGSSEFVQLFRNVVGEIEGSLTGFFSLFGGSIDGRITGETKTLPVLSCRKCGNEREIKTWDYVLPEKLFWSDMASFYFGIEDLNVNYLKEIKQVYLDNPLETRAFMLENPRFDYDFYNEIPSWGTNIWASAGFKINKIKRRFLFLEWESYPSWRELAKKIYEEKLEV